MLSKPFFFYALCLAMCHLAVTGCGARHRLEKIDPTIFYQLRGDIRPDKKEYSLSEPIQVSYFLANATDAAIEERVADGSKDEDIAFQGYRFDAFLEDPDAGKIPLRLTVAGIPLAGILKLAPGQKKLFVKNTFLAQKPGVYKLSLEIRWRDGKRISFAPEVIVVQNPQDQKARQIDPSLKEALVALGGDSEQDRMKAREKIQQLGKKAIPHLIELLKTKNPQQKSEVLWLLTVFKESGVQGLIQGVAHPDEEIRSKVIEVMVEIGGILVFPALRERALLDDLKEIRILALKEANKHFADPIVLPLFIQALQDKDLTVRQESAKLLKGRKPWIDFGFVPEDPLEVRERAVKKWERWWNQERSKR